MEREKLEPDILGKAVAGTEQGVRVGPWLCERSVGLLELPKET